MMRDSDLELHQQRRFLMVAFHPYGSDVCSMVGLPNTSLEVDEVERREAMVPWADLFGQGVGGNVHNRAVTTDQIIGLAQLYEQAAASLIRVGHPNYHRSLDEDLISFFIALVSLGGVSSEHS